jgi:hypothetical protein
LSPSCRQGPGRGPEPCRKHRGAPAQADGELRVTGSAGKVPWSNRSSAVRVDVSDIRRGRIVSTTQAVNGQRIAVQKRRAFAVFVG